MTPLTDLPAWARALAALVLSILFAGVTVTVVDDGPTPHTRTVHVKVGAQVLVDGPDADTRRDDARTVDATDAAALADVDRAGGELAGSLRETSDTSAAGVLVGPLASPEFPGCRTAMVRNFSSRSAGAVPGVIVWHQTVSFDRPGWDHDGLTARANDPLAQVSWHFLIGGHDGLCSYQVPLAMKAWTQGNANSIAIGIEVQAFGTEAHYVDGAGRRKLLAVTRELGRRLSIPMRRGRVVFDSRCNPTVVRRGIIEHADLGSCGGGHVDVTWDEVDALIRQAAREPARVRRAIVACRKLTWHRRRADRARARGERYWTKPHVLRARELKAVIAGGSRVCPAP